MWSRNNGTRAVSAIPVLLILFGVFGFTNYVYNCIFLAQILPSEGREEMVLPFGLLFNLAQALALVSYLRVVFTNPRIPWAWHDFVKSSGLPVVPAVQGWQPSRATRCRGS